nr:hypothetical protein Iba_chr02eCG8390 [Ipomoea batatas]
MEFDEALSPFLFTSSFSSYLQNPFSLWFPAIDLSAISDIDNARNSDAISTFGIIGFIFSAMVRALANGLEPIIPNSPALRWRSSSTKAAFLLQLQGWRRKVATNGRFQTSRLADDDTRQHC